MAKIIWIDTKGNRQESKEYSDIKIFRSYIYKYVDDIKIVEELDCNGLDTLYDERMFGGLFEHCKNLIRVEKVVGTSGVKDLCMVFRYCSSLESVPYFNIPRVQSMYFMFEDCSSLESVPYFDTSKVENMLGVFKGCSSLKSVPLFDTSSATYVDNIFKDCDNLRSYILPWDEYPTRSSFIKLYGAYKKSGKLLEELKKLWQK